MDEVCGFERRVYLWLAATMEVLASSNLDCE